MNRNLAIAALVGILLGGIVVGIYDRFNSGSKSVSLAAGKTLDLACDPFDNALGMIVAPVIVPGVADKDKARFGCKPIDADEENEQKLAHK